MRFSLNLVPHELPGLLVVVEGVSRAGKTTMIRNLRAVSPVPTTMVKWNSHPDIAPVTRRLSEEHALQPWSLSLLFLTDLRLSYEQQLLPALTRGEVVICDRYVYTAWVRDQVRGVSAEFLATLTRQFIRPDLVLYLGTSVDTVVERFRLIRHGRGYYGVGLDAYHARTGGTDDLESFRWWTEQQIPLYRELAGPHDFVCAEHESAFLAAVAGWRDRKRKGEHADVSA